MTSHAQRSRHREHSLTDPKRAPLVIGDVHGCAEELMDLVDLVLSRGHRVEDLVFLGDLVDRGPDSPGVVKVVRDLVVKGGARCVMGNHDSKHVRFASHEARRGSQAKYKNPMVATFRHIPEYLAVMDADPTLVTEFLAGLPTLVHLPEYQAVCVHAGLATRPLAAQDDKFCQHVRYVFPDSGSMASLTKDLEPPPGSVHWTDVYQGPNRVFYGHDVRSATLPEVLVSKGGAECYAVDTGCYAGGPLTAMSVLDPTGVVYQVRSRQPNTLFKFKRLLTVDPSQR